jgi:PhzF family phenazine biosynthesis protein
MTRRLPLYQIDAFTDTLFSGNPAAVVVLEEWIADDLLQKIAAENNLSETAFILKNESGYDITWFTPTREVDLCGHATLSAAHVIFSHLGHSDKTVHLKTRMVGDLSVTRDDDILYLDFPSRPPERINDILPCLIDGLEGIKPLEAYVSRDYMLVYESSAQVRNVKPDFKTIQKSGKWVFITAPASAGDDCDFVSRMFCAGDGIEEDPVTGSTHCNLIPYWAERLGKTTMVARQLSARGGTLYCELKGDRFQIGGKSVTFLEGFITLP